MIFEMWKVIAGILGVCGMIAAIIVGMFAIGIVSWTAIMKLVDWKDRELGEDTV